MAKTKIICDGVIRVCFSCKKPYPIECYHLRGAKKGTLKRDGRCKFCRNEAAVIRTQFLTAFHRNSKLLLSEEVYEQIVKMQKQV